MWLLSSPYFSFYVYLLLQAFKICFHFFIFQYCFYYFLKFWRQREKDPYFFVLTGEVCDGPTHFINEFCNISNEINKCLFSWNIIYCSWPWQWITRGPLQWLWIIYVYFTRVCVWNKETTYLNLSECLILTQFFSYNIHTEKLFLFTLHQLLESIFM